MSTKLTALTALTPPPTGDDLIYIVDDPDGTPASRKVTLADLLAEPIFLENLGTNWDRYAIGAGLFRVVRTLSDDQIKPLRQTPLDVIPAPGANKIVQPRFAAFYADLVSIYTGIAADAVIGIGLLNDLVLQEDVAGAVTGLLQAGTGANARYQYITPSMAFVGPAEGGYGVTLSNGNGYASSSGLVSTAIQIYAQNGGADFGGGNAANTMKIIVDYSLLDVS